MKYDIGVYKKTRYGHFILWDGPDLGSVRRANAIRKQREKEYPGSVFVVVKVEAGY